jgi:hypothetical protein
VAGAILLSPVLAAVPTWKSYYGEDETRYHSHLSEAYAVGTADGSLTTPILNFIKAPPR